MGKAPGDAHGGGYRPLEEKSGRIIPGMSPMDAPPSDPTTFWTDQPLPDGFILQRQDAPLGTQTVETILKLKPAPARTRDYLPPPLA